MKLHAFASFWARDLVLSSTMFLFCFSSSPFSFLFCFFCVALCRMYGVSVCFCCEGLFATGIDLIRELAYSLSGVFDVVLVNFSFY